MEYPHSFKSTSREKAVAVGTFVVGAVLFIGVSVFATDIGTNVTSTGHVFATGTVQATGVMIAYRDLQMGTTSPSNPLNFGAQFATSTYFSKFVGIGDATFLGNNNLKVEGNIFASSSLDVTSNATINGALAVRQGAGVASTSAGGILAHHADIANFQVGTGNAIHALKFGTCTVTPPPLKAQTSTTTACAATGVTTSDKVALTPPYLAWQTDGNVQGSLVFVAASTTANGTIRVQIGNSSTSTAVTGAASSWSWWAWQ